MGNSSWYYVKKGFSLSFNGIIKKKRNYFKYYLFMLSYILSTLCIFSYPIFSLANYKINKMIINEKDVNIFDSFEEIEKPKKYINYLFIILISIFIILGAIIGFVLICFCFELIISSIFGSSSNNGIPNVLSLILLFIGLICILVYSSIKLLPIPIILNENNEFNVSNTLKESFNVTKGIFSKLFFINFIISLFSSLYLFIIFLLLSLVISSITSNSILAFIIIFIIVLLLVLLYLLLLPIFFLANNLSTTLLIYDNSNLKTEDKSNENIKIVEELFKELEESDNE